MSEGGAMTTEQFMDLWEDKGLRQYLIGISKSFTKNMTIQEDLLQEAWLRISQAPAQKTREYYMNQGFKAIDNAYYKEWRAWRLQRWGKEHRAINGRVGYTEKKHKYVLKKASQTNM
jgi:DNA-directed RNA polymerase specialized sigma24 family protein